MPQGGLWVNISGSWVADDMAVPYVEGANSFLGLGLPRFEAVKELLGETNET